MGWKRLGRIYAPDGDKSWARSHAALPLPIQIAPDVFRFFFSARDASQRSHVGWVDVDLSDSPRVLQEAAEPALAPGGSGAFDEDGVGIGCLTETGGETRLYYMGWKLGAQPPWRNEIGLATTCAGLDRFDRLSLEPLLGCSDEDPHTLSYPCVARHNSGDWQMWYGSNLTADLTPGGMQHILKLARSKDGVHWTRDGRTALGFETSDEHVLARPTVVRFGEGMLMCFACRGPRYRIGAAYSRDGLQWTRVDSVMGLFPLCDGWEGGMACYPALFRHRGRLWLAYNGTGYGAGGFGLAVWEGEDPILSSGALQGSYG